MKNPELVKAFKAAKWYIESNKERFICCALQEASFDHSISYLEYLNAKNLIETRIGSDIALEEWLSEHILCSDTQHMIMSEEMRLYRLRWLDSLIAEFS